VSQQNRRAQLLVKARLRLAHLEELAASICDRHGSSELAALHRRRADLHWRDVAARSESHHDEGVHGAS
jgi:hypothetical protein